MLRGPLLILCAYGVIVMSRYITRYAAFVTGFRAVIAMRRQRHAAASRYMSRTLRMLPPRVRARGEYQSTRQ